jgi:uncharacterized protein YcfJ
MMKETKQPVETSEHEMHDEVARTAYELFERRGQVHGYDVEDWLDAERLVRIERRPPAQRAPPSRSHLS